MEMPVAEVVQKYDGLTRADEYVADDEFWEEVCDAALVFASELEKSIRMASDAIKRAHANQSLSTTS